MKLTCGACKLKLDEKDARRLLSDAEGPIEERDGTLYCVNGHRAVELKKG